MAILAVRSRARLESATSTTSATSPGSGVSVLVISRVGPDNRHVRFRLAQIGNLDRIFLEHRPSRGNHIHKSTMDHSLGFGMLGIFGHFADQEPVDQLDAGILKEPGAAHLLVFIDAQAIEVVERR